MIELSTIITISAIMFVYYLILQVFANFVRAGMSTGIKNSTLAKLRTQYKVTIRTFQNNKKLQGFSWLKSIWINESIIGRKKLLMFVFHHEYYHLKHKHKALTLLMRGLLALTPFIMLLIQWYYYIIILLALALVVYYITESFEKNANKYAKKMTKDEVIGSKR